MKHVFVFFLSFMIFKSVFSQTDKSNPKLDEILKVVNGINEKIEDKSNAESLQKNYESKRKQDSITLAKCKNEKEKLSEEKTKLESEKNALETEKNNLINEFKGYKNQQKALLEAEIAALTKGSYNIDSELLKKLQESSNTLNPNNEKILNNFITIRDSFFEIRKVLEGEYQADKNRAYIQRCIGLQNLINKNAASYPKIKLEAEDLLINIKQYCKKTNEVLKQFKKIFPLRDDFSGNDAFTTEYNLLYSSVSDYPYLQKLVTSFYEKKDIQEKYKDAKLLDCN